MRIVYFNHNVVGTGTYWRAYRLAVELARLGHDMTVVTTSRRGRIGATERSENGVTVIEMPDLLAGAARTGWCPYNTLRRSGVIEGSVDVIHAFDSRPAVILPALRLQRRTGARLAIDWADWWGRGGTIAERERMPRRWLVEPVETWFEEHFRTRADLTTTICAPLADRAAALGVERGTVHVIPQGCTELSLPERGGARARLQLAADAPVILHVGAAFRGDLGLALAAFAETRLLVPTAELVFAGKLPERLPPQAGVRALGRVSDAELADWLAAADCCVLPMNDSVANRGRWPSKLSDYLAAGRAVVLTDVGDVAQWVKSHECGLVCDAVAPALGRALAHMLSAPELRARSETNARALARGALAWPTVAGRLEQLYTQYCSAGTQTREAVLLA